MTLFPPTLQRLHHALVVSVQPIPDGPMDRDEIVVAMARAAIEGGAAGLRIEGIERVRQVRTALPGVPIIGLVKRDMEETAVRITPIPEDVDGLIRAGADIIAIDGTDRPRPHTFSALAARTAEAGLVVMADISTVAEAKSAIAAGAAIVGSTLSGYTQDREPSEPDLQLLENLRDENCFLIAEGRYTSPEQCAEAMAHGADCVTVGSALTRLELATKRFSDAISSRC
ncbi:N-acetylmannosamine-6-phosphate 2-epimerase [Notoacmeibacter ruber]|uniref:Putative N-acetylmannosamine-6-phosphate 2-epimerase n=1 Tax=Notoacmeibacter ruber TaxID=2670375 RepID=A0A3L7J4R2_9HYPH|nr:putative N-acetylmannosamine-6-phosphate 2-epimerase [Notoacmeibacter ruber]RLQ85305.1 putative N-acetylmannosamine-6-phosphate 2-epimerase [Notoacmeibacter ruber]